MIEPLLFLFNSYKKKMQQEIDNSGIELDLFHCRLLKIIRSTIDCTPLHLSTELNRDKAQITRSVNNLVKFCYVVKTTNPSDGRSVKLSLSPKGAALTKNFEMAEVRVGNEILSPLSSEESSALDFILKKIATSDRKF